ncbi:MAG: LysR family transcriptional regulator [Beijerinckiaceae bacterium]|nr:LysR family transcriptional regulator [Beijerinckiaceae bacterium]
MAQAFTDFDTGLLLTLDALLKDQNVTHAAARLNITQSALSARLTRLRQLLNDPLFIPAASGRGMTPTPHANSLQPELTKLIDRLSDFINAAHLFEPQSSKRVFRIAATDNPAAILAPDLIPMIKAQAPHVKIAFTVPDKARIATHLEQGDVDLFIGTAEDGSNDLIATNLFQDEFVTAQRIGHPRGNQPITLDEYCSLDHLLISTSGGQFQGMIDAALAEQGRERSVSVSIQSYGLAPLVLSNSDCICTLPSRFLERFKAVLDIFAPPLVLSPFQMTLFWHPRMRTDPAHTWLRKLVVHATSRQRGSEAAGPLPR